MIASVRQQSLSNWQLFVTMEAGARQTVPDFADPRIRVMPECHESRAAALTALLTQTQATYLVPLDYDSTLTLGALEAYEAAIAGEGEPYPILYADQDELDARGQRTKPWFKPQWDINLFLSQNYLSSACAIPLAAMRRPNVLAPATPDSDLIFSVLAHLLVRSEDAPAVIHVPYIGVTCPANCWEQSGKGRGSILESLLGGDPASRRPGQVVGRARRIWYAVDPLRPFFVPCQHHRAYPRQG
jgi:hypothetical protein